MREAHNPQVSTLGDLIRAYEEDAHVRTINLPFKGYSKPDQPGFAPTNSFLYMKSVCTSETGKHIHLAWLRKLRAAFSLKWNKLECLIEQLTLQQTVALMQDSDGEVFEDVISNVDVSDLPSIGSQLPLRLNEPENTDSAAAEDRMPSLSEAYLEALRSLLYSNGHSRRWSGAARRDHTWLMWHTELDFEVESIRSKWVKMTDSERSDYSGTERSLFTSSRHGGWQVVKQGIIKADKEQGKMTPPLTH